MNNVHPIVYSLNIDFLDRNHNILSYPLYFTESTTEFAYQLKSYKFLCLNSQYLIPQCQNILQNFIQISKNHLFSPEINHVFEQIDHINDDLVCTLPILINENHKNVTPDMKKIFDKDPSNSFYYYIKGQLYEFTENPPNIHEALDSYTKGAQKGELGCLLMLARIYMENDLSEKFQVERNPKKSLGNLLKSFRLHGLFDNFALRDHSIKQLILFNLYMDCFQDFRQIVKEALNNLDEYIKMEDIDTNEHQCIHEFYLFLINWLSEPEVYNERIIDIIHEVQISFKKTTNHYLSFIIGDLYDGAFYAISQATEFEYRTKHYKIAELANHPNASLRLAVMYEALEKFNQSKGVLTKSQVSAKQYFLKYRNNQNLITLRFFAYDKFLHDDNLDDNTDYYFTLLFYLQDTKILMNYCQILLLSKDTRLFTISSKMLETKVQFFYQIPLGLCYEKGIGVMKNNAKALEIYLDLFNKIYPSKFTEPRNFVYYRMGIIIQKNDQKIDDPYFKLAIYEILFHLKIKTRDIGLQYDFARCMEKGRGVKQSVDKAMSIYLLLSKKNPMTFDDKFYILKSKKRLDKYIQKGKALEKITILEEQDLLQLLNAFTKEFQSFEINKFNKENNIYSVVNDQIIHIISQINPNHILDSTLFNKIIDGNEIQQDNKDELMDVSSKIAPNENVNSNVEKSSNESKDSEDKIRKKIYKLFEKYKQENYNLVKGSIYISLNNKNKINILEKIMNTANLEITPALQEYFAKEIQEIFLSIAIDNNIRIYQHNEYALHEDEDNQDQGQYVTINESSQLLFRQNFEFSLIHFIKTMIKCPGMFHVPLLFSHIHILLIFGCGITIEANKVSVYYFMEPNEAPNFAEFNNAQKLQAIYSIAQVIHSFHLIKLCLVNFSSECIGVTLSGRIKFITPFLSFFDCLKDCDHDQQIFKGSLDYISSDYFRNNGKIHPNSDVFSFALWLVEIWTGKKIVLTIESEDYFIKTVKGNFFKDTLAKIPNQILSQDFKNFILACLIFHKKKRPSILSIMTTLEQLTGIKITQICQRQAIHNFYRSVIFSSKLDDEKTKKLRIHLPWNHFYVGQLKKGLPFGPGELSYSNQWSYKGSFADGIFQGNGKLTLKISSETFQGIFDNGYPKSGKFTSEADKASAELTYIYSWFTDSAYKKRLIQGFIPISYDKSNKYSLQKIELDNDLKNLEYIDITLSKIIEKLGKRGNTPIVDIPCYSDCFGSYYYGQINTNGTFDSTTDIIIHSSKLTPKATKIFSNEFPNLIGSCDYSWLELHSIDQDWIKYGYHSNTNLIARYYHFGRKYLGSISSGKLLKGTCFLDFENYFPLNNAGGFYKGQSFTKRENRLYTGEYRDEKANGMGIEYIDGIKRHEGEYKENNPYGKGIFYDEKGQLYYIGFVKNGVPWLGILIHHEKKVYDGKFITQETQTIFEGSIYNFSESIKELQGRFTMEDKTFNGKFKAIYQDDSIYEGYMLEGYRKGYGVYKLSDGCICEGEWNDQNFKGKVYWNPNENSIIEYNEGEFHIDSNGKIILNGYGMTKYKDGNEYYGEMNNQNHEGYGLMHNIDKNEYFEGDWNTEKQLTLGLHYFSKGEMNHHYEGEFVNGMKNGYGKLYLNNIIIFEGLWTNNQPIIGNLFQNNQIIYEGKVKFSPLEGDIIVPLNKNSDKVKTLILNNNEKHKSLTYEGEFIQDKQTELEIPNGYGKCTFSDNIDGIKTIIGQYDQGKINDSSKIVYENGLELYVNLDNDNDKKTGYALCSNPRHQKQEQKQQNSELYCYFNENHKEKIGIYQDQNRKIKFKYEKGKIVEVIYA